MGPASSQLVLFSLVFLANVAVLELRIGKLLATLHKNKQTEAHKETSLQKKTLKEQDI